MPLAFDFSLDENARSDRLPGWVWIACLAFSLSLWIGLGFGLYGLLAAQH
jgi:hypothetical protein